MFPLRLRTFHGHGGAFIHMGKTGGSSLSLLLRNGCHSFLPHPCRKVERESMASKKIESYYHVPDFAFLPQSHHDFYFITTRDPFDRSISAFAFEHFLNREARNDEPFDEYHFIEKHVRLRYEKAYNCFSTLERFVSFLEGESTDFFYPYKEHVIKSESCKDFARAAFHGKVRLFNHFYFSYARIFEFVPDAERQIFYITRQEHLWDDWTRINQMLGQKEEVYVPDDESRNVRNSTQMEVEHNLPVSRDLSARGAIILCRALESEYKRFFWFLENAQNLSPVHVEQAKGYARTKCPELNFDYKS
jgi:hypothetical protein